MDITGIDIYHGDDINTQIVADMIRNNQISFAYVKTGTGINGKDEKFVEYWNTCRSAGLICGAYHWFWPPSDPTQQATGFLNQYKLVSRAGVLPPVIDIEWTYNKNDRQIESNELWRKINPNDRANKIKEYINKIELELNIKPIIYTTNTFWKELLEGHTSDDNNIFFSNCLLWNADPNKKGILPLPWRNKQATFIQTHFGETAKSNEIFDKTDQDVFSGTVKQFLNTAMPGFTMMKGFPFSLIVQNTQQALIDKHFLHGAADGLFGTNTFDAVTAFQTANGLTGNGIIDAQTWNKILV